MIYDVNPIWVDSQSPPGPRDRHAQGGASRETLFLVWTYWAVRNIGGAATGTAQ